MIYYDSWSFFEAKKWLDLNKLGCFFFVGPVMGPVRKNPVSIPWSHPLRIETQDRHWANPPCSGQEQSPRMGREKQVFEKTGKNWGKYDLYIYL